MEKTDAVVIGAGPVGLFQIFQLGLQGLSCHVIDALPHAGGQCAELYGDKPIYDIPAIKVCTGQELTDHLLEQIVPFAPQWHLGEHAAVLEPQPGGSFLVETCGGTQLHARAVFIAAGVGAFLPRTLKLPGLEARRWRKPRRPAPGGARRRRTCRGHCHRLRHRARAFAPQPHHPAPPPRCL